MTHQLPLVQIGKGLASHVTNGLALIGKSGRKLKSYSFYKRHIVIMRSVIVSIDSCLCFNVQKLNVKSRLKLLIILKRPFFK